MIFATDHTRKGKPFPDRISFTMFGRKFNVEIYLFLLATPTLICHGGGVDSNKKYPTTFGEIADRINSRINLYKSGVVHENGSLLNELIFNPEVALEKLENFSTSEPQNVECLADFMEFLPDLLTLKPWAITMFDAYGKLGSGISQGNLKWPGSYSLCNSIVHSSSKSRVLEGQYCWAVYTVDLARYNTTIPLMGSKLPVQIGLCVPDSCSNHFMTQLLQLFSSKILSNKTVSVEAQCVPKNRHVWSDSKVVICFVFCTVMATIIAAATLYDMWLQFSTPSKSSTDSSIGNSTAQQNHVTNTPESVCADIMEDKQPIEENNFETERTTNAGSVNDDVKLISKTKEKMDLCSRIILCFSAYTNGCKLFRLTPGQDTLSCLNGIRVFSMLYVILGHAYLFIGEQTDNITVAATWLDTLYFNAIESGMFAVDSFFLLSGLLVTYLYLRERDRRGKISWIKFYVHRYLRLTPVYAIILFVFEDAFSKYASNGPFWPQAGWNANFCSKYWWANLLYINNFVDNALGCMGHTWYLANDMQFYVISPLILIFLTRKYLPIAAVVSSSFILINWICTGVIATYYSANGDSLVGNLQADGFAKIYVKPYCRIAPYVIGMMCGYALYRTKCKARMNSLVVTFGWLLAIGLSSSVVFGTYHSHMSPGVMSLYEAVSRSAWAVALAWMIFACCNGYGGVINDILSWPLWQPLGRLTYTAYLIHLSIIIGTVASMDVRPHFSHTAIILSFLGYSVTSYFFAIFVSLAFEAPFLALEKLVL